MINAVLVFNNAGQPRLTKFYTQLVHPHPRIDEGNANRAGNIRPAAPDIRNIHPRIPPPRWILQLPPSSTPPRQLLYLDSAK
jgi:hypothetical protein